MTNIPNLFKFIEAKRPKYSTPLRFKLLHDPQSITKDDLTVKGKLDLRDTNITSLPNDLTIGGNLELYGTQIASLPDGLKVKGSLSLGRTKITSLPDGLIVGRNIVLSNTGITSFPDGLKVGGHLALHNTPLSKQYSEDEISKMIQDKVGSVKGDIVI